MASSPRLRPQRHPIGETILLRSDEEQNRMRKVVAATAVEGGPFSFAATIIRIGRGIRCRYGRSRRAIFYRHDDCAASIPKSGPEIKNHCTKEGVNGEKLALIPKFDPEIKNHCSYCGDYCA